MMILPKGTKLWMQEGPANLHFVWYPGYAVTVELKKQNDIYMNFVLTTVKNNLFLYAYDENEMIKVGKAILKKGESYSLKLVKRWKKFADEYYKVCGEIDSINLSKLSTRELYDLYKKFGDVYIREYALPILADPFGWFIGLEAERLLKAHLKKLGREKEYNKFLLILTQPAEDSFIGQEKLDLLQITKDYINGIDISEKLENHAEKWYWTQNNYLRALVLDEDHFMERIKEHAKNPERVRIDLTDHNVKFQRIIKEKNEAIKELKLNEELKLILRLVDIYTNWQDLRKKANVKAQHYLSLFLEEVSNRFKLSIDDLKFTIPDELLDVMQGKKLNVREIALRKKLTGLIFKPEEVKLYSYEEAVQLDKEVQKQSSAEGISDLYGMVANVGKVSGIVKIIRGPHQFSKLQDGDILVTSMTRPDFVPILKKAGAIVTDEGSLTCHAAIVARELGVPCVVGTKLATKVLKDGDLVEVNANHGIIRRK